jgi:hypothetical protein
MPVRLKRKRKPKEKYELRVHSSQRLKQRYNIEDAWEAVNEITKLIRSNKATFLWRESSTRTHWLVHYDGQDIIAVYHKPVKFICTVLPKDAILSYGREVQILREQDTPQVLRD